MSGSPVPQVPDDTVRAIFRTFDRQTRRQRSILRLALVALMVLAVCSGTPMDAWRGQLVLIAGYGALSVTAAWLWLRHPERARRLRKLEPMVTVDVAALCGLQFLSTGSYLVLGLLAFLPFFIATHLGQWAAIMSVTAIITGALAIVTDSDLRRQMTPLQITTVLVMLALLCVCAYAISAVQQHRMQKFAALIASRELLLADVMAAEERERRQVAEALHDGPLQTLLAARQDLREATGPNGDPAGAARAAELVGDVSRELRQLTRQLHPSVLEEAGLEPAVRGLVETLVERTGAAVQCEIDYPDRHREDAMIYGVARELLTNVARHAGATTVWLTLRDDGDAVTLDVRDDGVGIDPAVISRRVAEGHIGLASQRSRIETMGGSWEFEPVDRGTWVRVMVPVRPEKEMP